MRPRGWPRTGEDPYGIAETGPSHPADSAVGLDSELARGSNVGFKSGHPPGFEGCWTSDLESPRVLDIEAVATPDVDVEPIGTPDPEVGVLSPGIELWRRRGWLVMLHSRARGDPMLLLGYFTPDMQGLPDETRDYQEPVAPGELHHVVTRVVSVDQTVFREIVRCL